MPYLSWQIHSNNQMLMVNNPNNIALINFKGFIVGNGATDWDFDVSPSFPDILFNFNIMPRSVLNNYTTNNCSNSFNDVYPPTNTTICQELWDQINNLWNGLNWYDLFRKTYPYYDQATNETESRMKTVMVNGEEKTYKSGMTFQEYLRWLKFMPAYMAERPVQGSFLSDYINRPDTRRALNIPDSVQGWNMCSDPVGNNYHLQYEGSIWIYKILMQYNYRFLFYSGDTDGAVGTWGTRQWIDTLNLNIV